MKPICCIFIVLRIQIGNIWRRNEILEKKMGILTVTFAELGLLCLDLLF